MDTFSIDGAGQDYKLSGPKKPSGGWLSGCGGLRFRVASKLYGRTPLSLARSARAAFTRARLTSTALSVILTLRSGGTGAAKPCEPRQVREEAAVRRSLRVLPANLPDAFGLKNGHTYPFPATGLLL